MYIDWNNKQRNITAERKKLMNFWINQNEKRKIQKNIAKQNQAKKRTKKKSRKISSGRGNRGFETKVSFKRAVRSREERGTYSVSACTVCKIVRVSLYLVVVRNFDVRFSIWTSIVCECVRVSVRILVSVVSNGKLLNRRN